MVPEFRERDVSKEIQPKMRFTASTQIERVIDAMAQNRNSVDEKPHKKGMGNKSNSITNLVMNSMKNNLLTALEKH